MSYNPDYRHTCGHKAMSIIPFSETIGPNRSHTASGGTIKSQTPLVFPSLCVDCSLPDESSRNDGETIKKNNPNSDDQSESAYDSDSGPSPAWALERMVARELAKIEKGKLADEKTNPGKIHDLEDFSDIDLGPLPVVTVGSTGFEPKVAEVVDTSCGCPDFGDSSTASQTGSGSSRDKQATATGSTSPCTNSATIKVGKKPSPGKIVKPHASEGFHDVDLNPKQYDVGVVEPEAKSARAELAETMFMLGKQMKAMNGGGDRSEGFWVSKACHLSLGYPGENTASADKKSTGSSGSEPGRFRITSARGKSGPRV